MGEHAHMYKQVYDIKKWVRKQYVYDIKMSSGVELMNTHNIMSKCICFKEQIERTDAHEYTCEWMCMM